MTRGESISVIIPVYNGEQYLSEAIECVFAQTLPSDELIVVDDGSTDDSAGIARSLGATVLEYEHDGNGAALNKAITAATGSVIAFLDADDLWPPDRCEILFTALQGQQTIGAAHGRLDEFISPELGAGDRARLREPNIGVRSTLATAMMIRRRALDAVGPFAEGLIVGTGLEWAGRLSRSDVDLIEIEAVVLRRRLHLDNSSMRHKQHMSTYARVLKQHLDDGRSNMVGP